MTCQTHSVRCSRIALPCRSRSANPTSTGCCPETTALVQPSNASWAVWVRSSPSHGPRSVTFVYPKSTSNFGPSLINFFFFLRKHFLMWLGGCGGQAEEPRPPFPPPPPALPPVRVDRSAHWGLAGAHGGEVLKCVGGGGGVTLVKHRPAEASTVLRGQAAPWNSASATPLPSEGAPLPGAHWFEPQQPRIRGGGGPGLPGVRTQDPHHCLGGPYARNRAVLNGKKKTVPEHGFLKNDRV